MATETSSCASYLVYHIVWRVILSNYHKSSFELKGQQQITEELVSLTFIQYFQQILGSYFYPIQTLILLEPYCGTITEPGLPVLLVP